jgi:hypothetical protein
MDFAGSIPAFRFMSFQFRAHSTKVAPNALDHSGFRATRMHVASSNVDDMPPSAVGAYHGYKGFDAVHRFLGSFLPIGTHSAYCSNREHTPKLIAAPQRTQGAGIKASEVAILDGRFWMIAHRRDLPLHIERVQAMVSGANPPKIMPEDIWTT